MKMRGVGITLISLALTTAVIGNAYYQKKQFYPSVVYITKSNPSMAVIYVQAFILVILMGKLMRKVFFGQLRAAEFEHLMERSWYALTETCLAFTVFRDDFSPKFVALFTVLLFLKSFHWLAEDRVDFMERSPVISWLFHLRVLSLLTMLGFLDLHFVGHAYQSTVTKGASVQLVFGFEYAILLTIIINIAIKYALHTVDLNSENPWDNKAVFLLYTELIMGFFKVILYVAFVIIMIRIYTLPLFAFRPMYYTMRSFKKALNDVIMSRRAIRNMNTLYPDATAEELTAADNVCIICREEMVTASKKLPCNHIFHTSCLRSWFQRQQTCPTCRLNILRTPAGQPPRAPAAGPPPAPPAPNPFQPLAAGGVPFHFWQPFQHAPAGADHRPGEQPPPAQLPTAPTGSGAPGTSQGAAGPASAPSQTPSSSAPPSGSPPGQPPMGFPLFCPPFPFLPFTVPPPMPPANLSAMTLEELHAMEGNARENVEARIQCLRNIQLLLDAAVTMMQQYSAAAAASRPSTSSPVAASLPQETRTSSTSAEAAASSSSTSQAEVPVTSNSSKEELTTVAVESSSEAEAATSSPPGPSEVPLSNSDQHLTKEQEEIRRRRLQKFAQARATE